MTILCDLYSSCKSLLPRGGPPALVSSHCWVLLRSSSSNFLPVGKRHQLVQDFLQPLQATFVNPRCARRLLFSAMQVQSVRFTDLRYFVSQLHDAFFDRILHDDSLAKAPEGICI